MMTVDRQVNTSEASYKATSYSKIHFMVTSRTWSVQVWQMQVRRWLRGLGLPLQGLGGGLLQVRKHRLLRPREVQVQPLRVSGGLPASTLQDLPGLPQSLPHQTVSVLLGNYEDYYDYYDNYSYYSYYYCI